MPFLLIVSNGMLATLLGSLPAAAATTEEIRIRMQQDIADAKLCREWVETTLPEWIIGDDQNSCMEYLGHGKKRLDRFKEVAQ